LLSDSGMEQSSTTRLFICRVREDAR